MITLNLLSPEQKEELKIKKIYIMAKEIVMLILLFTSIIAMILIASRFVLETELASIINKNASNIAVGNIINSEITGLNTKINRVHQIQSVYYNWSKLLEHLSVITPDNITYTFIKLHKTEASLELTGTAKTREDLLSFKDQLMESEYLSNTDVPLDNLLAKENNQFRIRADINLSKLK